MDTTDPKEILEEECKHSQPCLPLLRLYQECNARVTAHADRTPETCQQELFDLLPCVDQCVL